MSHKEAYVTNESPINTLHTEWQSFPESKINRKIQTPTHKLIFGQLIISQDYCCMFSRKTGH